MIDVKYSSIPAFCINMAQRTDRWGRVSAEFAKIDWPVQRWEASVTENGYDGCTLSHRAVWQHIVDNNLPFAAVFEDDVVFPTDFARVFPLAARELPYNWDVWHLHSARARTFRFRGYLTRFKNNCWGSHGYLVTRKAAQRLLALPNHRAAKPIDYVLSKIFQDAGGRVFGTELRFTLCFQTGVDSDIPTTSALLFWQKFYRRYWR